MTGGYQNKVLRVDLTNRKFTEEPLSEALIHDFIGGRGFGVKLLYDDLKPGIDPLGRWGPRLRSPVPDGLGHGSACLIHGTASHAPGAHPVTHERDAFL